MAVDERAPTGTDASLEDALARARPVESPALVLARARVASTLFGAGAAAGGFGRFRVLERLGAGGMGVVYAAYDPDLDRGVALKVVHVPGGGRDAALAEAKALARLSHPNVVPIYDVGALDEHVYLVMELVRGVVLRRWVEGRPRRAVLDAYRQAGQALAAAHAAGLVHRDVKPDNAIVGRDGRVRVVDFGLACEAAPGSTHGDDARAEDRDDDRGEHRDGDRGEDRDGGGPAPRVPVAGTPRYMAPEQAAGAPVTAAADQYAFCVSLAEALAADDTGGPPPRWLAAVLERGRAADPGLRFPSMVELLHALSRDPARTRRRRLAVGALVAGVTGVAAAAFTLGRADPPAAVEPCTEAAAELDAAWSTAARAREIARVSALGPYGAVVAPRLARALADHEARWTSSHRDACLAHRRGAQSGTVFDRRMACLYRGRAARAELATLTEAAGADALAAVARAAQALPDPRACDDLEALLADPSAPPPALTARVAAVRERLARARVRIAAGRAGEARELAAAVVVEARASGFAPLVAEALLTTGHAAMLADGAAGVPALAEATDVALRAGDDARAVEAWARRAWAQGTDVRGDRATALAGLDVIDAIAARTPSARFARALLHNNVGSIELARDQRAAARAAFETALALARDVDGPEAIELLAVQSNLAVVTDDPARQERLFSGAIAALTRVLGAEHPDTLRIRAMRATTTPLPLADVDAALAPVCEAYALHPGLGTLADRCWAELAFVRAERGDHASAAAALVHAVAAPDDPPVEASYLPLWRGDPAASVRGFTRALAAAGPPSPGEPWWRPAIRAQLELGLGRALRAAGDPRRARPHLAASAQVLEALVRDHPAAALRRRLDRARAELAAP